MNLVLNIRYVIKKICYCCLCYVIVFIKKITLLLLIIIKITSFSYYVIFVFSQYTRGTRVQHVRDNTRVELDVRDNTRAVKPRGSLSGTLRGIPGGGERGPRVTRGHVGWKSTHGAWVWHAAWTPRG